MSLPECLFWLAFWAITAAFVWVALIRAVFGIRNTDYVRPGSNPHQGFYIWISLFTLFILRLL